MFLWHPNLFVFCHETSSRYLRNFILSDGRLSLSAFFIADETYFFNIALQFRCEAFNSSRKVPSVRREIGIATRCESAKLSWWPKRRADTTIYSRVCTLRHPVAEWILQEVVGPNHRK